MAEEPQQQPRPQEQQNPFEGYRFAPYDPLRAATRSVCPKCARKRRYYCFECQLPLTPNVPRVTLPVKAEIIHHPAESLSKSTSLHGPVLAPDWVTVRDFPDIPDYAPGTTVLLYPREGSVSLRDIPREEFDRIERVVLVDSQWHKTGVVLRDPRLSSLPCVKIAAAKTAFWRYQSFGSDHLSTVEALYWFQREYFEAKTGAAYDHSFDDLLWYFSFFHTLIQEHYRANPGISFNHIPGYINYS